MGSMIINKRLRTKFYTGSDKSQRGWQRGAYLRVLWFFSSCGPNFSFLFQMESNAGQPNIVIITLGSSAQFASKTFAGNICQILSQCAPSNNGAIELSSQFGLKIEKEVLSHKEENENYGQCTIEELPGTPTPHKPKVKTTPKPDSTTNKTNTRKRKFMYQEDPNGELSLEKKRKINKAIDSKRQREERLQYMRDLEAKVQRLTKENKNLMEEKQDLEKRNDTLKLENEELKKMQAKLFDNANFNFSAALYSESAPKFTYSEDLSSTLFPEEDLNTIFHGFDETLFNSCS